VPAEVVRAQRSDAVRNRAALLAAADRLFAATATPAELSMEDVATAAGVGKATLFRAFGSREALVQELWAAKQAPLEAAITSGPAPLGPGTEPRRRILAVLDAFLVLKLDNRHLTLAVEDRPRDGSLFTKPAYRQAHHLLTLLLAEAGWGEPAGLAAHALLGAIRADLVDHLAADRRSSRRRMRADLAALAERLLDTGP
jgi:AcrR family transcriptional regulator